MRLDFVQISNVFMGNDYHATGMVHYDTIRVCGKLVKDMEGCACRFFSESRLLGANFTESNDNFIFNSS